MKDTQLLKDALLKAIEVDGQTVVRIHDVALSLGLKHVASNDIRVMATNICRKHPDYKLIALTDRGQRNWSVFVNGVLTCLDFSDDDEEGD